MKFRKNRSGPGIEIFEALPGGGWKRTVSPSPDMGDAYRVAGIEPELETLKAECGDEDCDLDDLFEGLEDG